jgi:regulatory protein spx
MMQKRAQMYYRTPCEPCEETKAFLEEQGVMLTVRDIGKEPLRREELRRIVGFVNPLHYLDPMSPAFAENNLDSEMPTGDKIMDIVEDNPELLRHPIIIVGRLMTIGNNRQQLTEMLQLSENGDNNNGKRSFNTNSNRRNGRNHR